MLQILTEINKSVWAEIEAEKKLRQTSEFFLLFALGSQFDHLIKMSLEKLGFYCLVADPASITAKDVERLRPSGIVLSGGPASVQIKPPPLDSKIFDLGIPVLGICLGFQMWAKHVGAPVSAATKREFGVHKLTLVKGGIELFHDCPLEMAVLESHGDNVEPAAGLEILGRTENSVAAARCQHLWGVQFHPEVSHTQHGLKIMENFCLKICGARDRFPAHRVAIKKVAELKEKIAGKKIILALSGGSDSAVVAYLLKQAYDHSSGFIRAIYIKGIDRPDDEAQVLRFFSSEPWLDLKIIDATTDFLTALKGKVSMHEKRLAMRGMYKDILNQQVKEWQADYIAQGTLYTDISESAGGYQSPARKAQIKLHHNVNLVFDVPELVPLADQVKDTARNLGRDLSVPEELLIRHPFPGPGLVVRIEGEVTPEKLTIARLADGIFIEELKHFGWYEQIWQAGAVVTNSHITFTKGDDAGSGLVLALWAVTSVNGFTASWAELPPVILRRISTRLTNEISQIGAVVYRISDKPPTTIEWG